MEWHKQIQADLAEAKSRIAELERGRCEDCGATLNVSGCQRCGAPVCCPQCCQIQSLTERARKAERERERDEARKRVAELEAQVVAEKECRDRTYIDLGKATVLAEALEADLGDELAYLEADEEKGGE